MSTENNSMPKIPGMIPCRVFGSREFKESLPDLPDEVIYVFHDQQKYFQAYNILWNKYYDSDTCEDSGWYAPNGQSSLCLKTRDCTYKLFYTAGKQLDWSINYNPITH